MEQMTTSTKLTDMAFTGSFVYVRTLKYTSLRESVSPLKSPCCSYVLQTSPPHI